MDTKKILADAIKTIGLTMPVGMEVFFFHDLGAPGACMTISEPNGKQTEYRFLHSDPLPTFAVAELERSSKIEQTLRDLLGAIERHADELNGFLDSESLSPEIDAARALLAAGWQVDTNHPANRIDRQPATVSYPTGSLGEAVEG
jgi:hypothetical protein